MKKYIALMLSIVLILAIFTGCKKEESITNTLSENIAYRIGLSDYSLAHNIQLNGVNWKLDGKHSNGAVYLNIYKNSSAYTDMFLSEDFVLLKNTSTLLNDLKKSYGELENSSTKYIEIPLSHENINLENIDFSFLSKYNLSTLPNSSPS